MKKKIISILLMASMVLLTACSGKGEVTNGSEKQETAKSAEESTEAKSQQNVSVVTGPTGGSMFVMSASWSDFINKYSDFVQITNQVGGGSAYCVNVLSNGEADFAMVGNDVAYYAMTGQGDFEGNAFEDIRCIGALYAEGFHVITRKDSGITNIAQILSDNASVTVGPPGSGTLTNSARVLEAYGTTVDDTNSKQLDWQESADAIKDGHIDAAFYMTGVPYGLVSDISVTQPILAFGLEKDIIDSLHEKYPFLVPITYPADSYEGSPEFDTVCVRMLITTTEDMDEDTVYEVTKILYENLDEIAATHSCGSTITKDALTEGLAVPLHPGAEKYYKEVGAIE